MTGVNTKTNKNKKFLKRKNKKKIKTNSLASQKEKHIYNKQIPDLTKMDNEIFANIYENQIIFESMPTLNETKTKSNIDLINKKPFQNDILNLKNENYENKEVMKDKNVIRDLSLIKNESVSIKNKYQKEISIYDENLLKSQLSILSQKTSDTLTSENCNNVENKVKFYSCDQIQNIDFEMDKRKNNFKPISKERKIKPNKRSLTIHDFKSDVHIVYKDPFEANKSKKGFLTQILFRLFGGWFIKN
ncbi:hypothetical protein DMUE_1946 [Dictyocoela muelleri]|nr:hypothetical protein DMUE_1946 [Dictyocoela muelleri]